MNVDVITALGWGDWAWQNAVIDRLARRAAPDLAHERTALYVCPECGDLGCGAVSAVVSGGAGVISWSDFGFKTIEIKTCNDQGLKR